MEHDLDAPRRAVLLESDDRVHGAGKSRGESRHCSPGTFTNALGHLRVV